MEGCNCNPIELERRIQALEEKVAELKVQVSEQPKTALINITGGSLTSAALAKFLEAYQSCETNIISKEKLQWMQEVGMKEFPEPQEYYLGGNHVFSEDYIKNTPLKKLQERYDKRLINYHPKSCNGEPINTEEDL